MRINLQRGTVLLLAVGAALLALGIACGDTAAIFRKAIFICLECIGIA